MIKDISLCRIYKIVPKKNNNKSIYDMIVELEKLLKEIKL
jgi:hypothetical protein